MKNIFIKNVKNLYLLGIIGLLALALFGIPYVLRKSSQKDRGCDRTLRIGMMSGWPPYMSIDERGEFVGFDVDVARLLGKQLGCPVEIVDGGSLSSLFLSLETGKIDLIFSGLDITKKRRERMNMVPYTGEDMLFLYAIFNDAVPQGISVFADLERIPGGATVCVEANSASEELLQFYPLITKKQLKSMADMVLDVRTGKSTALLAEPQVARRLMQKDPQLTYLKVPLTDELKIYGCGIAIKKENRTLTDTVTRAIVELRSSGKLAELEKKWNLKGE